MLNRRSALAAIVAAATLPPRRSTAQAAEAGYPTRAIRVIVPFTPGGGTDLLMRLVAPALSVRLGRPLVVDNVGGAGGTIGAMQAIHAAPDGYTLLCGTPGSLAINPVTQSDIGYQPLRDLAPATQVTDSPVVLVCNNETGLKSVAELIERARAAPDTINYGSAGPGSLSHLSGALFCALAGVKLVHVPYRGTGQSLVDLRAGRVQLLFENMPAVMTSISGGQVRALAVGTAQPFALLPDLPTLAASGAPGYVSSSYMGLLAPAGTPRSVLERVSGACRDALADPNLVRRLHALGVAPTPTAPDAFAAFISQRIADLTRLSQTTGLRFN